MTTFKQKNNLTTIALSILTAFGGLGVATSSMAQNQSVTISGPVPATTAPAANQPVPTPKPTVPQAPKQDYVVKDLSKKQTPVGTPLAMTESYTASVQDKEKAANAKNVGVISRSVESTTTTSTVSQTATPAATQNTPNANAQVAAQPSITTTEKTTTTTVSEKKPFDEKSITANVKPAEKSLKQMNEINARLAEVELLQKLKEAEYKLQQPIEDKDKKGAAGTPGGGSTLSANGNMVAAPFNPVIRGGGQTAGLPTGAPSLITPPPTNNNLTVYSVVGFDNDYTAKINLDGKSTYTVKKGDTLPDGQLVTDVTRYYIVVSERSAVGRPIGTQRIYVTGKPLSNNTRTSAVSGNSSSASPQAQNVGNVGLVGGMPAGGNNSGPANLVIPGQNSISSARTVR